VTFEILIVIATFRPNKCWNSGKIQIKLMEDVTKTKTKIHDFLSTSLRLKLNSRLKTLVAARQQFFFSKCSFVKSDIVAVTHCCRNSGKFIHTCYGCFCIYCHCIPVCSLYYVIVILIYVTVCWHRRVNICIMTRAKSVFLCCRSSLGLVYFLAFCRCVITGLQQSFSNVYIQ